MDDAALLLRQQALQREADEVVLDLGLDPLLGELGKPVRVGSSALGLMSWRDLDVTVVCPSLSTGRVLAVVPRLAAHPRVRELTFRNDTGVWNTDPAYPDGLYLGLGYRTAAGAAWNVDLWFVDEPDRQPDLDHLRVLPPRLTDAARLTILAIKQAWAHQAGYRSIDVYTAVLDDGVQTPEDFETWRAER
ncbi:MAG: hypothetical protein QOF39_1602 [Frankiales bacterium]|jgi:hypothetical protein|nr:hypothetical protein [Frankiales bacterium]